MSVVAWDGYTLAVDRQGENAGHIFPVSKSRRLANGEIVAWTGGHAQGLLLAQWYEDGADPAKWPAFQSDKDSWTRLIVAKPTGIAVYEQYPVPMIQEGLQRAYGAGRDFALGALAMGADARRAVEIASELSDSCGMGVDVYEIIPRLSTPKRKQDGFVERILAETEGYVHEPTGESISAS